LESAGENVLKESKKSTKRKKRQQTPNQYKTKLMGQIHGEMRRIAITEHPSCVCCGSKENLQGGHVIPKKISSNVRFDLMNVFTQCRTCNYLHQFKPHLYINWYIKTYGAESYNELVEKSKITKSWKIFELEELLERYKQL